MSLKSLLKKEHKKYKIYKSNLFCCKVDYVGLNPQCRKYAGGQGASLSPATWRAHQQENIPHPLLPGDEKERPLEGPPLCRVQVPL